MIDQDCLSPQEASYIAHNAYFTLKDWISGQPTVGMESRANVRKMVTGDGMGAAAQGGGDNTSLRGTGLAGAKLDRVFAGSTNGTSTGFGYVLSFSRDGRRHVVVATRGTRAEHSKADLYTDLRASMTSMAGIGPVHHGFRNTFDSVKIGLARDDKRVMDADVVHCVGHSLGGAVATLVAAHFGGRGKDVKLYTFGSPRVGALGSSSAMEQLLGKRNIFRVAHDLDPVTMVGPYPFSHVNGLPTDDNNMILVSPTGKLLSVANHDMREYVTSVGGTGMTWANVRLGSQAVDRDNAVLAKWLLRSSDNPGWMTQSAAQGLSYLMKAFGHVLKVAGYAGVHGLTAIDLFSATLAHNLTRQAAANPELMGWLRQAAGWARIVIVGAADITGKVIRGILMAMMSVLRPLATLAIVNTAGRGMPLPLLLGGATAVTGAVLG
ncbi:lipase family protein [Roseateles sp.]|uniref:lipase family protein n=1 Tax=Roseateles sp. TaxID=1971397 RepID=UPI003262FE77